jgi:ribulose-phosphate 3-epimerase
VKIAPSFLTADVGRLAEEVRAVEAAGADQLHIDIMDGHFVPPITFGTLVVEAVKKVAHLPLDIHMMVERPERHLESFAEAGGDILNVHVEACPQIGQVLAQIKNLGRRAGVCLNPGTPLSAIEDVLGESDQVILMGVEPGWGGQPFLPATLPKMRRLRGILDERGLPADIEIDGGVKIGNAASCAAAGATILVAGSVVFNDKASVAESMRALREALAASEARA